MPDDGFSTVKLAVDWFGLVVATTVVEVALLVEAGKIFTELVALSAFASSTFGFGGFDSMKENSVGTRLPRVCGDSNRRFGGPMLARYELPGAVADKAMALTATTGNKTRASLRDQWSLLICKPVFNVCRNLVHASGLFQKPPATAALS